MTAQIDEQHGNDHYRAIYEQTTFGEWELRRWQLNDGPWHLVRHSWRAKARWSGTFLRVVPNLMMLDWIERCLAVIL